MNYKYRFTLFTPCYNSAKYIHRVFKSIDSFTIRDFEWIVINDASTDNTNDIITDYISSRDIKVKYINRESNKGILQGINDALHLAEGYFFIKMDHDDEWAPNTLDVYDSLLKKYDSPMIAGIAVFCKSQFGDVVGDLFSTDVHVANYWEAFFEKGKVRQEIPINCKTSILVDYYDRFPETANKHKMIACKYNIILSNAVLRTYYVNENPDRLSNRSKKNMVERIGIIDFLYFFNYYQYVMKGNLTAKIRLFFQYPYYGIIAGKGYLDLVRPVEKFGNKLLFTILYLPAKIITFIKK